jgi:hypothetical protein
MKDPICGQCEQCGYDGPLYAACVCGKVLCEYCVYAGDEEYTVMCRECRRAGVTSELDNG